MNACMHECGNECMNEQRKDMKEVDILTVNCEVGSGFTVFMYIIHKASQQLHHSLPLNGQYKDVIGLCLCRLLITTTRNTSHLLLFSASQMKMISSTRLSPTTQPCSHPHDLQNYVHMHRTVLVPVPAVYFSNRRPVWRQILHESFTFLNIC